MLFNTILLSFYFLAFIACLYYLIRELLEYIQTEKEYAEERKRYYNFKKMYVKYF